MREGLERGELPDEVRVIYVSPLKALSADIHKNLAEPRREIRRLAEEMGYPPVRITAAVRSGDTPQSERAAMLRTPPHILVTTPESLYLLLTAETSRDMLKTARVVIVDEIHAVLESRRGAHLALSLERLDHACGRRLQRIGLSATQKPIEEVARFLVGSHGCPSPTAPLPLHSPRARGEGALSLRRTVESDFPEVARGCAIVDRGHKRRIDLAIEVPGSPLEAVMSAEVWQEIYQRLVELVQAHRTTLIMVNTRRLAERMAHHLTEQLGAEHVAAHHGSLSKEKRLDAEERLRSGQLKVLVSTASLELGIDIGHVDLVCQISSPNRIATLLQRVGRSGHTVRGLPKGRVFPLTRDDLVECAAMVRAASDGELDRISVPDKPLDVLAQQIVAESAAQEWDETALFELMRGAYPYRNLARDEYDDVLEMLAQGYATRRGRRAALVHHDAVNEKVRARKGSRMTAIMCGGAIPEVFDYRVLLEPEGTFVGTLNEDFAIESLPGDIFQLGNTSWRILRIEQRRGACGRRARPAAVDAFLAGRSAGAQQRSERSGVAAASGVRTRGCLPRASRASRTSSTPRLRGSRTTTSFRAPPPSRSPSISPKASGPRRRSDRRSARPRTLLRRVGRHAARPARALSAAASIARGASRSERSSARASTSSCRRRRPKKASSSRSARRIRSRWMRSSAIFIRTACAKR